MSMLNKLSKLLKKYPVKSIFVTLIIIILLAIGTQYVYMATGNDTLVKNNTDVYKDNVMLEEEFGGESIIVLYESENLLTPNNLTHMKGLEEAIQTNDAIYSIMSPVTLVEEIANKQSGRFNEGILEIIDGLNQMGSKLTEIGAELEVNAKNNQTIDFPEQVNLQAPELGKTEIPEPGEFAFPEFEGTQLPEFEEINLPDMEGQMTELNKGFSNIIDAQKNLEGGTKNLVDGYAKFGNETKLLGENLHALAEQLQDNPEKKQLQEVSKGLSQLSKQMTQISEDTSTLPGIPSQTINGLETIQQKLSEQIKEQNEQQEQIQKKQKHTQEQMKEKLQKEQEKKEEQIKQKTQEEQVAKKEEMKKKMEEQQAQKEAQVKEQMLAQQAEKEKQMQDFQKKMKGKQEEQEEKLLTLGKGLVEMGEKTQTISENLESIHEYSDIMTPGLPKKQATLNNMIYDDGKLRSIFDEVVVDEQHMLMMIKFKGGTNDATKSELVRTIQSYLNMEESDDLTTIVSGKPVLDDSIRSSMKNSMQKMMGLALLIMVIVLFFVFKVRWRIMPLVTVLIAVIGTVGLMGWLQIPITMVSMAVFPILIGLGIDYAIQFQNRYAEEMAKEDINE
ncbi:MMPL family transporter [Cerasibacillus terrae]|nr:MMPL family transporter [Cerasibacillus terrae]